MQYFFRTLYPKLANLITCCLKNLQLFEFLVVFGGWTEIILHSQNIVLYLLLESVIIVAWCLRHAVLKDVEYRRVRDFANFNLF